MGILDDAIREHLELKRKHGAPGDDVERLEKEAFGPSKRPDDEERDEEREGADEDVAASAEAEPAEPVADEEGDGSPFGPDLTVDWDGDADDEERGGAEASSEPDSEEMSPAERARVDYAELDDTADHPALAVPDTGEEDGAAEPVEPAESAIFDAEDDEGGGGEDDFGDIDLDLDVEDEAAPSRDAAPSAEGAPTELQPEQGGDDELEIDFELDDLGEEVESTEPDPSEPAAPEPSPEAGDDESFEADDASEDDLEDEDEDLLEETPDFLQDAPEGERLWFEQGEPKDFDFDD